MSRLVALLRGINLGDRRVKMAELRGHFEAMGLEAVESFLASGNVLFDPPDDGLAELEREIEGHLAERLGYPVDTFLRPLTRLEVLAAHEAVPGAREEGFTPHAIFLRGQVDGEGEEALRALETEEDAFVTDGREVLWMRRGGITDSEIATADLDRALGGPERTMRKLTTVERIVAKFGA